jgi:L-glutamine-phosphate cytidylyltransferase
MMQTPIARAIILAAGQGQRLGPAAQDRPKCLVPLAGRTLIDWQIDALVAGGVKELVVVTGYRAELVEAQVARRDEIAVRTLFNPFYEVANNLGTCWTAREEMEGDFLILNGDTIISAAIVARLQAGARFPITVTVDVKDEYDDDDMKVQREGDRLLRIGKTLTPDISNAESIGFLAFREAGGALFRGQVETMMRGEEGGRIWYLSAIDALAATGQVGTVSIAGLEWQEVDFPPDLIAAQALTERWRTAGA